MHDPRLRHWAGAKHSLKYLKGTFDFELLYSAKKKFKIIGFCDSDWAQEKTDRKSVAGCIFLAAGGPIVWKRKKQSLVAQSSRKADKLRFALE